MLSVVLTGVASTISDLRRVIPLPLMLLLLVVIVLLLLFELEKSVNTDNGRVQDWASGEELGPGLEWLKELSLRLVLLIVVVCNIGLLLAESVVSALHRSSFFRRKKNKEWLIIVIIIEQHIVKRNKIHFQIEYGLSLSCKSLSLLCKLVGSSSLNNHGNLHNCHQLAHTHTHT